MNFKSTDILEVWLMNIQKYFINNYSFRQ